MKIFVNGTQNIVADGLTAQQLLVNLDLFDQKCAMEINEIIVPRSEYAQYILQAGDNIEIIHAIGGG